MKAQEYCKNLLRNADYENYLTSLFTAQNKNKIWAIKAFNIETAIIRDRVSDVSVGKIKFAWWKECIKETFAGRPPNHPVAQMLAYSLETSPLSISWFNKIINERELNLNDPQYATASDLENYAENTASSLLYLQLEALDIKNLKADHVASHLGKSIGISTILRSTPHHIKNRRLHLPSQLTAKYNVSSESIFKNGPSAELSSITYDLATLADQHYHTAASMYDDTELAHAYPIFLNAIPSRLFLDLLAEHDFNIFYSKLHKRSWKLPFKLISFFKRRTF